MLLWYFHFGNFNFDFVENLMKKPFLGQKPFLRQFGKVLLKFYYVTIFKELATLDRELAAIIIVCFEDFIVLLVEP